MRIINLKYMTAPKGAVLKYLIKYKIFRLGKGFIIVVILFLFFIINQWYNWFIEKIQFYGGGKNGDTENSE